MALHLAAGWYTFRNSERAYKHVNGDRSCAIITAEIRCPYMEHVDLEAAEMKDGLMQLAIDKGLLYETDEQAAALHAMFIGELEQMLGHKINVIEVRLAPPPEKHVPKYSIKSFGAPIVYVVRNSKYIRVLSIA